MQNQGFQIVPVQQQDYSQWENIGLLTKILSGEFTFMSQKVTWERFFGENEPMYCAVAKQGEQV